METKRIWAIGIIALLVSGTAVAVVAMAFDNYKKLTMATDIEKGNLSSESIAIVNESIDLTEYAKQQGWNLKIREVSTVKEALELMLQKEGIIK
jgi:hypothetical protein